MKTRRRKGEKEKSKYKRKTFPKNRLKDCQFGIIEKNLLTAGTFLQRVGTWSAAACLVNFLTTLQVLILLSSHSYNIVIMSIQFNRY